MTTLNTQNDQPNITLPGITKNEVEVCIHHLEQVTEGIENSIERFSGDALASVLEEASVISSLVDKLKKVVE